MPSHVAHVASGEAVKLGASQRYQLVHGASWPWLQASRSSVTSDARRPGSSCRFRFPRSIALKQMGRHTTGRRVNFPEEAPCQDKPIGRSLSVS